MAPPVGESAQAHQPRRLGGDAVGSYQLLLLAQRVQEAKRMRAEPDDRHDAQQHERAAGARRHPQALAPMPRREYHERQHQSG